MTTVPSSGEQSPRLLPAALEHRIHSWAIRSAGCVLVAASVLCWLALLSWQLSDPTLSQAGIRAPRNLLGPFGAQVSDLLIQTLGIAVIFALICPMVWGLELLSNVQWLTHFRMKLVAFPLALLALAGAASGLPAFPTWPLQSGSGGMLGDLFYSLATIAAAMFSHERSSSLATLVLTLIGLGMLVSAMGLNLRGMATKAASAPMPRIEDVAQWWSFVPASMKFAPKPSTPVPASRAPHVAPEPAPAPIERDQPLRPPVGIAPRPVAQSFTSQIADTDAEQIPEYGMESRGIDFDTETEEHARSVAERFAPGVATTSSTSASRLMPAIKATLARARGGYRKPSLNLLKRPSSERRSAEAMEAAGRANAQLLHDVLADFGVKGELRDVRPGPVITRYEFEPMRGTKTARIVGLADDFARSMSTHAVRVAPTPGRSTIGIEVPNEFRDTVHLREILETETFTASPADLPLALGKGINGEAVVADLARMPHLLIAGTTGSGKSVGVNTMILSLIYRHKPADCRLLLIDPKMLELAQYNGIPHLLAPVVTDPHQAAVALEWAVGEMEERYKRMSKLGVRNIEAYNQRARSAKESGVGLSRTVQTGFDEHTGQPVYENERLDSETMPFIVVVVDEFADLMMAAGKRVEAAVQRLAQMARAAGIHLVMATQRPSVDVVTGTIKANFPMRMSFRVASKIDSRTILNDHGAEQLLGQGDMLLSSGSGQLLRVHGAFVSDEEVERVTEMLREQGEPAYIDVLAGPAVASVSPRRTGISTNPELPLPNVAELEVAAREEIFASAVAVVLRDRKVSTGHLNRRLGIDELLATELIERMQQENIVGPINRFGRRPILLSAPKPLQRVVA